MQPVIGQSVSNYKIIEELGPQGAAGHFLARDVKVGRMVALRLLPPGLSADAEALEQAFNEARAVCEPSHPHICTIHGTGVHEGRPFVATEVAEGESLAQRLARGPLEMEILLDFGVQIADALQAAHARNVFHGALGPETVVVTEGDQIKVMEFGLARLADPNAAAASVAGDIHALGRILHAMATGKDPGEAPELPPVASVNPQAPQALDAIIDRATGRNGQAPFRDAAEMAEALSQAMVDAAPEYVPPPPAEEADQTSSGEPEPQGWPWGLVAAAVVAIAVVALIARSCL